MKLISIISRLIVLLLVFGLCVNIPLFSIASTPPGLGNGNSGGNDPSNVSGPNYWPTSKHDGVRITIVDPHSLECSATINWLRYTPDSSAVYHFGNTNKLDYLYNGASVGSSSIKIELGALSVFYTENMPRIVNQPDFQEIKRYFCDEETIRTIVANINSRSSEDEQYVYDELITSELQLLIEPLMYVIIQGQRYILTPTEAVEVAEMPLNRNDPNFVHNLYWWFHKEFPFCMFLEYVVFGIDPWNKNDTSNYVDIDTVKAQLGLMAVSFQEQDESFTGFYAPRRRYPINTEVYTSVQIKGSKIPEAVYTFSCNNSYFNSGDSVTGSYAVGDESEASTFVWNKWTTPPKIGSFLLYVSVEEGVVDSGTYIIEIYDPARNVVDPLDPVADGSDKPPNYQYSTPNLNNAAENINATWWTWHSERNREFDEYVPSEDDEDEDPPEEFLYYKTTYQVKLSATAEILADSRVPTANSERSAMGSGYGINATVTPSATAGGDGPRLHTITYTDVQRVKATFCEFGYENSSDNYGRWLVTNGNVWSFQPNPYSRYEQPVHFIPVWYPDTDINRYPEGGYTVKFQLLDLWTPAGELKYETSASITINGSVYDDYYVQRAQW